MLEPCRGIGGEHPSGVYRVDVPDGWWTNVTYDHPELGELAACQFFAPEAFDVATATRDDPAPVGVALTITYLDGGCVAYISPVLETRVVTVDGREATLVELAPGTEETDPPGTYQYEIELTPATACESEGETIVASGTSEHLSGNERGQ